MFPFLSLETTIALRPIQLSDPQKTKTIRPLFAPAVTLLWWLQHQWGS